MKKQRSIKRLFIKRESLLLCFIFLYCAHATKGNAQWKKIHQFANSVDIIYFSEFDSSHQLCFVGIEGGTGNSEKVLRSTNAGNDWTTCTSGKDALGNYATINTFCFKDSLEGWCSGWIGYPSSLYRTADGGKTWNALPVSLASGLVYVASTKRLIGSLPGPPPYYYSLDGSTFTPGVATNGFNAGWGIAFSDDFHGIITGGCASPQIIGMLITADGGLSWQNSGSVSNEQFDPLGIKGTQTFFLMTERACGGSFNQNDILRSDDGGLNWRKLYTYFANTTVKQVTGSIKNGRASTLFFQTFTDSTEGIMMSDDTGHTFHSICGPNNYPGTKFYVRDTIIYAGDKTGGLWINTTGIGSFSTPQLSATTFQLRGCGIKDTVLSITFFDSCSDYQAKLISATLDKQSNFSLQSPFDRARTLHTYDSLVIHYDPNLSLSDTAHLHLCFHLGFKDFDTTLLLVGSAQNEIEQVRFIPTLSEPVTRSGKTTDIIIKPDKFIQGKGLNSLSFHLQYNGDLLTNIAVKTSLPSGTQIIKGTETRAGKITTLPITITGNDLPLGPAQAVATITMQTSVTDTLTTELSVSNLKLNNGDPAFANCVLSVDTTSTKFTLALNCTDTILYHFLKTKRVLGITSITPNPSKSEVKVNFYSNDAGSVTIQVFDLLGTLQHEAHMQIEKGIHSMPLTLPPASGTYYLRLSNGSCITTEKIVKQ